MFDSAENIARAQPSVVHFLHCLAKVRRFCLRSSVKMGFFRATRPARPASVRRLLTVWGEIAVACCSHRLLLSSFDNFLRSCRVIRIKWRSVLGFDDRFRPLLGLLNSLSHIIAFSPSSVVDRSNYNSPIKF